MAEAENNGCLSKMIEKEWESFVAVCFPPNLNEVQLTDLRRTFYGGCAGMYGLMLRTLSPGDEITEADLSMMRSLRAELDRFNSEVKAGRA